MNRLREEGKRRTLVIHGHFYQPPREDPWIGEIEEEPSAAPYPDWNTRIEAECYRPVSRARILYGEAIEKITNAYRFLNFDVGPTLAAWMEAHDPETLARIVASDREAIERLGHGNAIAQAYNHPILPLCDPHDLETQIRWGLADFRKRFGREAEAMWLPETAVNDDVAAALAAAGMRYVILAPGQVEAVRPPGGTWSYPTADEVETRRPYLLRTAKGNLAAFVYHGGLAAAVSFGHLLRSAEGFAERIEAAYDGAPEDAPLVHFATDGEIYGHHEPYGEMCLAYAAEKIFPKRGIRPTNYAAFLDEHPPTWEVRLAVGEEGRGTSWSCAHGVGRWMRDCGCRTGGEEGWNQAWRGPLREALDFLRGRLRDVYLRLAPTLFRDDPWEVRNAYVEVLLAEDQVVARLDFAAARLRDGDDPIAREKAFRLLESQRNAMLMYTSCGWFFHDLAGIETIQVLKYAHRAIGVLGPLKPPDLEEAFLSRLCRARSNVREEGDGRRIWRSHVAPSADAALRVAHAYLSTAFDAARGDCGAAPWSCFNYEVRATEWARESGADFGCVEVRDLTTFALSRFLFLARRVGGSTTTWLAPCPSEEAARRHVACAGSVAAAAFEGRRGVRRFGPEDLFAPLRRARPRRTPEEEEFERLAASVATPTDAARLRALAEALGGRGYEVGRTRLQDAIWDALEKARAEGKPREVLRDLAAAARALGFYVPG